MNYLILIAIAGWILAVLFFTWYRQEKMQLHCPRCGKAWKKSGNIADDTYMCKCGMTTYDRHKYEGSFEERSENY